ncbi:unnamed protein product [Staurois parvus]|uniref:MHC class I antigen n=1 Tax=Staurois parvus TaxID=386267 RepID=A0ABN9CQX5_9NEOB|nr:unnamed protein product [Staurois parvus]
MRGPGETRYSEVRGPGRPDIVSAGSWETRYSECGVRGRPDIVNAGSGETRYSECRVRGDQIYSEWSGRPDIVNAGSWSIDTVEAMLQRLYEPTDCWHQKG